MRLNSALLAAFAVLVSFGAGYYFGYANGRLTTTESGSQTRMRTAEEAPRARQETDRGGDPTPPVNPRGEPIPSAKIPVDPEPENRTLLPPLPNLKKSDIQDTFHQSRGTDRVHEATDILAPRDTPVFAVVDGEIKRLFLSKAGGNTIYQFDRKEQYSYYYAHLERYEPGLKEGQFVKRGAIIGYVGTSGNARPDTPHLHFAIFRLGPEKRWWEGVPINPYPLLMESLLVY